MLSNRRWLLVLLLNCPIACKESAPTAPAPAFPQPQSPSAAPAAEKALPAAPPAANKPADKPVATPPPPSATPPSAFPSTPKPAADGTLAFGGFKMVVPPGWVSQAPPSTMRVAQFELPKLEGDEFAPSVIVFYFGAGGGGPVDQNIQRWRDMFEPSEPASPGTTEVIDGPHGKITLLDKTGIYKDQPRMMAPDEYTPRPGFRMLAAAVEVEAGPLFVRAVGPEKSLAAQKDAMIAALKSMQRESK